MHNKIKILYVYEERIPDELRNIVRSHFPSKEFFLQEMNYSDTISEQKKKIADAHAVFFAPGRFLSNEVIFAAKKARIFQLWSSGFDKFNVVGATAAGIPVAVNGGANASSVAEHTVLLMLAVCRSLPEMNQKARSGAWGGASYGLDMQTLEGKRLGIIGFGKVGRAVAKKVSGFGMKVAYVDIRRAPKSVERQLSARAIPFKTLVRTSDIISLHLRADETTRGIIGAREFSFMKKGVILINTARAELVDEGALLDVLRSGKLRGAGLDVFCEEPPHASHPIFSLPNVVATPHSAGSTRDAYVQVMKSAVANIRRALSGKSVLWSVNNITRQCLAS